MVEIWAMVDIVVAIEIMTILVAVIVEVTEADIEVVMVVASVVIIGSFFTK
jgi:hypothetical protein